MLEIQGKQRFFTCMIDFSEYNREAAEQPAEVDVEGHGYYKLQRLPDNKYRNEERVAVGHSVKEIPANAFRGCPNLVAVRLCWGTTVIGNRAFSECHKLEEINIPASVQKIGDAVFEGSNNLKRIDVEGDVLWQYQLDDEFQVTVNLDGTLLEFNIPRGDCEINGQPVSKYKGLLDCEIPDTVERDETYTRIWIPSSVSELVMMYGGFQHQSTTPTLADAAHPVSASHRRNPTKRPHRPPQRH